MAGLSAKLQRALDSDCADDLNEIIQANQKTDFDQLRQLISTSPDVDTHYRTRAIYALGRWGDDTVVDDIIQVMPFLDELGQLTAIESLGRLGSDTALQEISKHADDPSPHVRKFTIHALGSYDTQEAKAKLIEIREKDPDQQLRALATEYIDQKQK